MGRAVRRVPDGPTAALAEELNLAAPRICALGAPARVSWSALPAVRYRAHGSRARHASPQQHGATSRRESDKPHERHPDDGDRRIRRVRDGPARTSRGGRRRRPRRARLIAGGRPRRTQGHAARPRHRQRTSGLAKVPLQRSPRKGPPAKVPPQRSPAKVGCEGIAHVDGCCAGSGRADADLAAQALAILVVDFAHARAVSCAASTSL